MKAIKIKEAIRGKHKKTSTVIEKQFPDFIVERHPLIVEFMKHYYSWMEREGAPLGDSYRLLDYLDLNKTKDEFIPYFLDEYAPNIPDEVLVDKKLLIKHIIDFYVSKGTESSYRFLFRILFGTEIDFIYPSEFVLKASDGIWVKDNFIKTTKVDDTLLGRRLFGAVSGASAIVDKIDFIDDEVSSLKIKKLQGVFLEGEFVETRDANGYISAYISGLVRKVDILSKGSGYVVGELLTLDGTSFYQVAVAVVTEIDVDGGVVSCVLKDTGAGYSTSFTKNDVNNKGASIKSYVGGVFYDTGSYVSERGKLNSVCRLQDGRVYQDFSYIIKSILPVKTYIDYLKNILHPSGMFFSGICEVNFPLNTININNAPLYTDVEFTSNWISQLDLDNQGSSIPLNHYKNKLNINAFDMEISQEPVLITFMLMIHQFRNSN